ADRTTPNARFTRPPESPETANQNPFMIDSTSPMASGTTRSRSSARIAAALRPMRRPGRKKLGIERVFSQPHVRPFDEVEWERRTAEITDDTGKVIFRQTDVEVPR